MISNICLDVRLRGQSGRRIGREERPLMTLSGLVVAALQARTLSEPSTVDSSGSGMAGRSHTEASNEETVADRKHTGPDSSHNGASNIGRGDNSDASQLSRLVPCQCSTPASAEELPWRVQYSWRLHWPRKSQRREAICASLPHAPLAVLNSQSTRLPS
jgi:hypothetical protein